MRYRLLLALLALFVVLVAAQSETATETTAAEEEDPTPTEAEAEETPTATPTATRSAADSDTTSPTTTKATGTSGSGGGRTSSGGSTKSTPPADVLLRIPNLSVGKIELIVDNLKAEVNLAAQVAQLVEINVGVQVGIEKVNITIADVSAQLELVIRLGHLVDIVNRTLQSLDLNPLLINLLDTVTDVVTNVIGAVDGLLGSIVQGNSRVNFFIDNLGNVVQEVVNEAGDILSSIVGNYQQNMTYTGQSENLGDGLTQKTYEYGPLGALVNIIFNGLDQIVSASVIKGGSGGGSGGGGGGGGGGSGSSTTKASTTKTSTTEKATSTADEE